MRLLWSCFSLSTTFGLVYGKLGCHIIFHWVLISSYQTWSIVHCTFSVCFAMMLFFFAGGNWWRICSQICQRSRETLLHVNLLVFKVKWKHLSYKQALLHPGCYFCLTRPGLELCCCSYADEDVLFSLKKSTHFYEAIPCRVHFWLKCNIAIMQKCWELSTSCPACSWSTGKHRILAILNAFWFLSKEALLGSLTLHTSWHGGGEMPP